ncbi:MAG: YebC/PmpR family DNA-binding transcriptional regulator, partial [Gammaproteobacteria bacterium]
SDEDTIMEAALEAGAEDVVSNDDGSVDVLTEPDAFMDVKEALIAAGLEPDDASVTQRPENTSELDADTGRKVIRLIDMLEDLDDVQDVYHNADIPAEAYEG